MSLLTDRSLSTLLKSTFPCNFLALLTLFVLLREAELLRLFTGRFPTLRDL